MSETKEMRIRIILCIFSYLMILLLLIASCNTMVTEEEEVVKDIEYGRAGDIPLLLDMYVPKIPIAAPIPAIVLIHGGGWSDGNKAWDSGLSTFLTGHGFFVVSINYRLSGVAKFPAQVEDSKCAVRWLRANAEKYNVDPKRIGVWGKSAGGHLAMMVACADETSGLEGNSGWLEYSSRVKAVCSYCGPSCFVTAYQDLDSVPDSNAYVQFLGGHLGEIPEIYEAASPKNYVTADDPPLLLVHGDCDQAVPIYHSENMYEAYQQAGLQVKLIVVTGANHNFQPVTSSPISPSLDEIEQMLLDFFVEHLVVTR